MTKAEIVRDIAQNTGVDHQAVHVIVDEFMTSVKYSLSKGENVYLRGFGTFEVVKRAEKIGRNISKGTALTIPAHNIPKFKPSLEFKDSVK